MSEELNQYSNVSSPFCGSGTGRNVFSKIRKDLPPYKLYVEPYVSTGTMYFKLIKPPNAVINDTDNTLIEMYKILKNTKDRTFRTDLNNKEIITKFLRTKSNKDTDKLMKYIIKYCNTFGSSGSGKIYKDTNPANKLKYLDRYNNYMRDTRIFNDDPIKIVKQYDSSDTFFFIHPPFPEGIGMLDKEVDYEELSKVLKTIKGKFILIVPEIPEMKELFKSFKSEIINVPKSQNKAESQGSKSRREMLFKNFTK